MISIDQNSHSLWDTLPKLHVLAAKFPHEATHYVEDIDVAFTALGSESGDGLEIVRERFYRSGGSDWGASLFYTDFLGRQPTEIRNWEKLIGMKLKQLAGAVDTNVDALYDDYSVSDNWMLIGPSFVDGDFHRVIGDLGADECAAFIERIFTHARRDTLARFPSADSQRRTNEWFDAEWKKVSSLIERNAGKTLPDLYADWLSADLTGAEIKKCGELFSIAKKTPPLVDMFVGDYEKAAGVYNEAVAAANVGVHGLDINAGELPFYAVSRREGRFVRAECFLRDGKIIAGDMEFATDKTLPREKMLDAGVVAVAGKAVLLVLQARLTAGPLVLPYHGSLYMPAVHEYEKLLRRDGVADEILKIPPVMRVRFRLTERMRQLGDDVILNLPEYLRGAFGTDELPARRFAEILPEMISASRNRLRDFTADAGREYWQRNVFGDEFSRIAALDVQKRDIARQNPKDQRLKEIWDTQKSLKTRIMRATLDRISADWRIAELDFYDSRGAILPWCVAMGGESFYNSVIDNAEIYPELP